MFRQRIFYYVISLSFVGGIYLGLRNSFSLLSLTGEKEKSMCLALSSELFRSDSLEQWQKFFLDFKPSVLVSFIDQVNSIVEDSINNCPAQITGTKELKSINGKIENVDSKFLHERVSPHFLGLKFDPLSKHLVPLSFYIEEHSGVKDVHLIFGYSISQESVSPLQYDPIWEFLLTPEGQTLITRTSIFKVASSLKMTPPGLQGSELIESLKFHDYRLSE